MIYVEKGLNTGLYVRLNDKLINDTISVKFVAQSSRAEYIYSINKEDIDFSLSLAYIDLPADVLASAERGDYYMYINNLDNSLLSTYSIRLI